MKCPKCGKNYSNKVYPHHIKRCKKSKQSVVIENIVEDEFVDFKLMKITELREYAKEKGYKGYTNLSKGELITFLKEKE